MSGQLNEKIALVTGGGAGIGEGIARRFADEGAKVVVAELDSASGQAVAEAIGGIFVGTDVSDRAQVENAVQTTLSEFGSIDIVVNNAWGGGSIGRVEKKTDDQLAHGIAIGYYGPYWAMRAAFPHMKERGWGRVINMCSLNGVNAHIGSLEYNAAKEAAGAHPNGRTRMGADGRHRQRNLPGGQEPGLLSGHRRLPRAGGDGRCGQPDGPHGPALRRHRPGRGVPGQ